MLLLENWVLNKIISIVENKSEECCGFLFGWDSSSEKSITHFSSANNVSKGNRANRYEISAQDYLSAEHYALNSNLQLIGIYHTHLNHTAIPSHVDKESAFPFLSYLIISLKNNKFADVKSWKLNDQLRFEEEKISIIHK